MPFYNLNGDFFNSDRIEVDMENRALKYGDGFFETIKIIDRSALLINLHFERILQAATKFQFRSFPFENESELNSEINKLIKKSKVNSGRLRISFYRADGGFYQPLNNDCKYYMEFTPTHFDIDYSTPIQLGIYDEIRKPKNILSSFKVMGSHWNILASIWAKDNGFDDAIILNEEGMICETTHSNLFFLQGEEMHTPHLQSACVDGVFRKHFIKTNKRYKFIEREIKIEELHSFEQVFTTNAIRGMSKISSIDALIFNTK